MKSVTAIDPWRVTDVCGLYCFTLSVICFYLKLITREAKSFIHQHICKLSFSFADFPERCV